MSVAVRNFGEEYAKERGGRQWASDDVRDEGVVVERKDGKFLVKFSEDGEQHWFARKVLRVVSRAAAAAAQVQEADTSADEEDSDSDSPEQEGHVVDSSDDDDGEGPANGGWSRNDEQFVDERQRQGFCTNSGPVWSKCPASCDAAKDEDDPASYFFEACLSWFPLDFFTEMADEMQTAGRAKGALWASWKVTVQDQWQWIGVWFYMLAFEEFGDRRAYFPSSSGTARFGPRHVIEEYIIRGKNGSKGVKWFENMLTCFSLPTGNVPEGDPFHSVRHMWDTVREHFRECVSPGWLVTLDESMVKWLGRAMPGLMVVPRKPTPVGLEIHTLCCSLSGVLVYFEIYEGKEAMENKEFVGQQTDVGVINKSTALTLRCVKPYFGSVRTTLRTCLFNDLRVDARARVHVGPSLDCRLVVRPSQLRSGALPARDVLHHEREDRDKRLPQERDHAPRGGNQGELGGTAHCS